MTANADDDAVRDGPDLRLKREVSLLREQLTAALRTAILQGDHAPGQKLSERVLCERYDVSRSLLRETLQQLAAEALVELVPHRGPHVATITERDARDIYAVRRVLEGLVAAAFAQQADEADRARLARVADDIAALGEGDSPSRLLQAKNAFYAVLVEGAGNRVAAQLLTQLNNRITLLRRLSLSRSGRLAETKAEITAIVEALVRRDGDEARRLTERHVDRAAASAALAMAAEPAQSDVS